MRYLVGIDLGTTNNALAFIDLDKPHLAIQLFAIPQLSTLGKVDTLPTLPSFCYLSTQNEWPRGTLKLPWKDETSLFVGQFAKIQGARVPTKLVQSAKSWLSNIAANRRDKILPLEAADIQNRLSPVEASAQYLMHLRDAWNHSKAKGDTSCELEEQEIILTVPASFDEIARTLTIEAAHLAGLRHVTLLEEPQAAFYSWISQHETSWKNEFKSGDRILICDVGGGTTDFSLIEMQEKEGELTFQRMAVGDHLLLGGDNMDAALAHYIEQKLLKEYPALDSNQWLQLTAEAREAKEHLLKQTAKEKNAAHSIVIQGQGSSIIKGSMSVTVNTQEVEDLILNGFFGQFSLQEAVKLNKSRGIRSMGLPYEDEPSITKHLAYFLNQANCTLSENAGIDYLLFNGGTMKPTIFQEALLANLNGWFPQRTASLLPSFSLDLAVARGAVYYGKVRRGLGVAIKGGLPRTYYLEIEVQQDFGEKIHQALTLLPRGTEEGYIYQSKQSFLLRANTPVVFHLLTSNVRLHDKEGDIVTVDENEFHKLPPIETVLRYGKKQLNEESNPAIPVALSITLTPIGTIEIWLNSQNTDHRWNLEFQLRSVTGQDNSLLSIEKKQRDQTFSVGFLEESKKKLEEFLQGSIKPTRIVEILEHELHMARQEWSPSILRGLYETLIKFSQLRTTHSELEARWWNLVGFCMRPGFGYPLDDFRIKELWKIILGELKGSKNLEIQIQKWICFRRIAGGLNKGQQMQIMGELISELYDKKSGKISVKRKSDLYIYSERIRALAALERLELPIKIRVAQALVDKILRGEENEVDFWALGRLAARHLFYGSAAQVIPKDYCAKWIEKLLDLPTMNNEQALFMLGQMARKTEQRELNIPETLVQRIIQKFPNEELQNHLLSLQKLSNTESEKVFGEALPTGLILS